MAGEWRTGRKVGRTIYSQVGDEPSDDDELIGVFDTPELAQRAVTAVNNPPRQGKCGDEPPRLWPWLSEGPSCSLDVGHASDWHEDETVGTTWRKADPIPEAAGAWTG